MQNSKKIYMILTNGFDPDVRVYKEAKYLVKKGFDVTILCWDRKCEYGDRIEETLNGVKVKRFLIPSVAGTGLKQLFPYLKFIIQVRKYLKNKEYNYLHCHDFDGALISLFVKNLNERKKIFDMHEIYTCYSYGKSIFFKKIFNFILKKADYIIYVNEEQLEEINQKDKVIYLPNYPDSEVYLPIEKKQASKTRINYIGSVRDYDSLAALANIEKKIDGIKIGLYGTGIAYEKLIENYSNCEDIEVYGKYDGIKEIGDIYRKTDILYCSYNPNVENWKKSYPVKFFEAIVTMTPIIVTKDTVVGDFVKEKNIGELITYCDEDSIELAINNIIENYEQYVENLRKIVDTYSWKNIVTNLDVIYRGDENV